MGGILVVQNKAPDVHLGLWEQPLKDAGYEPVVIDPAKDAPSVANFEGVIILGGPSSINDLKDPKVPNTLKIAEQTLDTGTPGLGSCLGLQAFVKAAGGVVEYCDPKQNGVFDEAGERYTADITDEGLDSPLLQGVDSQSVNVFQAHEKHVILPNSPEAKILALDKYKIIQIAQVALKVFGMQFHPEITREQLDLWIENAPGMREEITPESIVAFEAGYRDHTDFAELLIRNWIRNTIQSKAA